MFKSLQLKLHYTDLKNKLKHNSCHNLLITYFYIFL